MSFMWHHKPCVSWTADFYWIVILKVTLLDYMWLIYMVMPTWMFFQKIKNCKWNYNVKRKNTQSKENPKYVPTKKTSIGKIHCQWCNMEVLKTHTIHVKMILHVKCRIWQKAYKVWEREGNIPPMMSLSLHRSANPEAWRKSLLNITV